MSEVRMKEGAPVPVNLGGEGGFERAISGKVSLLLLRAKSNANTITIVNRNTKIKKSNTKSKTNIDTDSKFNFMGK